LATTQVQRVRFLLALGAALFFTLPKQATSDDSQPGTAKARMVVGALDGMTRAGLSGEINRMSAVQLYAARGEYEPFQIAVDAEKGSIGLVSVAVSDLRSADGVNVISRTNLPIFREHFVKVTKGSLDLHGSNRPLGPGMFPDALIPTTAVTSGRPVRFSGAPATVEPEARAMFWIDLWVPRQTSPGSYSGTVTVLGGAETAVIPISLVVWRHTLPLRPSFKSSFGINRKRIGDARLTELLLAHRLMPFLVDSKRSTYFADKFGLNASGLWFFGNANVRTCKMDTPPAPHLFRSAIARYPSDVETYEYAADEIDPCPSMFPALRQWSQNVHEAGGKLLVTVTPTPELFDDGSGTGRSVVDIWVLLPKMYIAGRPNVEKALRKGDEVWSYNALVQDSYSPKWQIDFDPINYRIQPGYLSQSLGLAGLLYSEVDHWNSDPWVDTISLVAGGHEFAGEDMLVYPGEPAGSDSPLASMRLKWLRKGVEDYEQVEMLKRSGHGEWALDMIRSIASDWKSWTHDPAALESVRRRLGTELDRLEALKATSLEKAQARLCTSGS
jgi:Domain of unknown function (DUF4091)